MGLFGDRNRKNQKLLREAMKNARPMRKMVQCPNCGSRMTVTFLNPNDSCTCRKCGTKIWASSI